METVKNTLGRAVVSPIANLFTRDSGPILVTAGNGVVGYRVSVRLLRAGYPSVRVGDRNLLDRVNHDVDVRDPDASLAEELKRKGAESVDFCWEREDTYDSALKGIKTVFVSAPGHEGWTDKFPAFLKACKSAGVRNIVKLSFYHALAAPESESPDPFGAVPLVKMHKYCDAKLMKSGLDYTILFATHLMSNPLRYQGLSLRSEGKFYGASTGRGVNYVSPNDVADVAIRALLAPRDHRREGYTLTGPEAITDEEVAVLLGRQFNKTIEFVNQDPNNFKDVDFAALELVKASGVEERAGFVSRDVENVCGRPAETYEDYLLDRASMSPKEQAAFLP